MGCNLELRVGYNLVTDWLQPRITVWLQPEVTDWLQPRVTDWLQLRVTVWLQSGVTDWLHVQISSENPISIQYAKTLVITPHSPIRFLVVIFLYNRACS